MIRLIRRLDLATATGSGRRAWLSAASGLVRVGDEFCVVADDELHLGRFTTDPARPGRTLRLFAGELPRNALKRKKRKPDLEVLLRLPPVRDLPQGALLALGSGSRVRRQRGALLALGTRGRVTARPRVIDASDLFRRLSRSFADLNLEGGWVSDDGFHLLQRGNKGSSRNAMLRWNLRAVMRSLHRDRCLPDTDPVVREFDLGDIDGVPLCFTDASPLPEGGWLFTAAAEDTDSVYDDGSCLGSAIGRVDARSRIRWIRRLEDRCKVEGIDATQQGKRLRAYLVTDADDPKVPANLLQWEE